MGSSCVSLVESVQSSWVLVTLNNLFTVSRSVTLCQLEHFMLDTVLHCHLCHLCNLLENSHIVIAVKGKACDAENAFKEIVNTEKNRPVKVYHSKTKTMLTYKIICICIFALITTESATIQDSNSYNKEINYRLPNHTKPIFYDLKLNPHLKSDNFTFDGEVLIHIEILKHTRTLTLHTKNLIVDKNTTFLKAHIGFDFYFPTAYDSNDQTELLNLGFDEELSAGHYTLYLKFAGILNDRSYGFYRSSYINDAGDTVWFAGTNFMATYARAAFPCWDEPALKASFKIAVKHYRNYTAISNMPISEESDIDENDGKTWTQFEESPVISTYLVSFLIFDLRNISNSDGTINVWGRRNVISSASFAHEVAQKAAIELKRYTNSSVQLAKIDHVALPDRYITGYNKGMESWGLIIYREGSIVYDEDNSPIDTLYRIVDNVIHQSSHQWFGNVVSPSWWTNIWINEGLAEYFKYYIADKIYKDWRIMEFLVTETLNLIFFMDSFQFTRPLNFEPNTIADINLKSSKNNHKASLLLRMLSHCLSDDVFHAGLIRYLDKHKYGVVKPEDLWNALQDAFNESAVQNKFKIREVMDTWTEQKGYPLVTVIKDQRTGKTKITQEYFQPYEKMSVYKNTKYANASRWWIPINFAIRTNPDFSSTLATHWSSPEAEELVIDGIDPQDWIIVNIQQTGFYRVNYDTINWLKIADYLDSENYTKIHVLNRAQIINDAIHLMFADKLDPRIFMDVTKYLRRETDYIVWYSVFKILGDATKSFAYNGGGELLKTYYLDLMSNIVETIGMQDHPNDDYFTKLTRNAIFKEACALDHPTCLHEAYNQLIAYLENYTTILTNRTSFHKKKWIFCNGIKQANETIWNKLLYMYTNMSEPTWYCLGHSKNRTIIEKFLNMTISENSPLAKNDVYRVIYSVLNGDYPYIDVVMDFIANHWDKLITRVDDPMDLLRDISWNVVSRNQIQKIKALLSKLEMKVPQIVKIQEQNIELTETIVNKIRAWLEHKNLNLSINITS